MTCDQINSLIEEFYDGELDTQTQIIVEGHTKGCRLCSADLHKMFSLDELLGKSSVPPPSSTLDRKLMETFSDQSKRVLKSTGWWNRVYVGSVSIPKPAFAAALIMVAIAVAAANMMGRYASMSPEVSGASSVSATSNRVPELPAIGNAKPAEVPNAPERIMTRIVYVDRPAHRQIAFESNVRNRQRRGLDSPKSDPSMSGTVAEKGYFTKVNLGGFRPLEDMNLRVIKKEKSNEK